MRVRVDKENGGLLGDTFNKEEFTSCVFVPLVGEHGWKGE